MLDVTRLPCNYPIFIISPIPHGVDDAIRCCRLQNFPGHFDVYFAWTVVVVIRRAGSTSVKIAKRRRSMTFIGEYLEKGFVKKRGTERSFHTHN